MHLYSKVMEVAKSGVSQHQVTWKRLIPLIPPFNTPHHHHHKGHTEGDFEEYHQSYFARGSTRSFQHAQLRIAKDLDLSACLACLHS